MILNDIMQKVDNFVYGSDVAPYHGWHHDHVGLNHRLNACYMPALQQDRGEFKYMLFKIVDAGLLGGSCLQLGLGVSGASHEVWRKVFTAVVTIDLAACLDQDDRFSGLDTHSLVAVDFAAQRGPFDFLFIDAGHSYADVAADYMNYKDMVRPGGLIAFHDALERDGYPEVEVHKFLATGLPVTVFGDEVGTAVMVKK